MDLHLSGKSVVITGGSDGIGKAAAFAFLKEGACVTICGRSQDKLDTAADEAKELGYEMLCIQADVGAEADCDRLARAAAAAYGSIDVWINNAGILPRANLLDASMEEYDRIMNINLRAAFYCSRLAVSYMKERKSGVILNASSWASILPQANTAIYGISKAGVSSLTRSLAGTVAPYGIRAVAYVPGVIATDMNVAASGADPDKFTQNIAQHRMGTPEEVANVLVFLASDAAGYINGVDIEIAGGKFAVQDCSMSWNWMKDGKM